MRKTPGFAAVAILSLALGIGANSAIYSIYSSIFLRKPPLHEPDRLVEIYSNEPDESIGMEYAPSSYPDYMDIRDQGTDIFEGVLLYNVAVAILELGGESKYLFGEEVTANYFDLLGVEAALGRTFIAGEEDLAGALPTVILSYSFWQNQFGGDPDIIGRTIPLNGYDFTIIGVAPEKFNGLFPINADLWYPITVDTTIHPDSTRLTSRSSQSLFIRARLRPDVTADQARAALDVISGRLSQEYPDSNSERRFLLVPSDEMSLHPQLDGVIKGFTYTLMGMVGLVLLIACMNLASMLLARATVRRKEIGVRLAVGASRFRLVRQLLTESTLLSLIGGFVGLGFAWWLIKLLLAVQPPIPIPININIGLDANVLFFAFCLSLVTGIVFGLLPATRSTRPELVSALKDALGSTGGRLRKYGLRSSLVVVQVAVSALFLTFAGLFLRSLGNASSIDPGFDIKNGVVATLETSESGYTEAEGRAFFDELATRMATLPGVVSVGMSDRMPLGYSISMRDIYPETDQVEIPEDGVGTDYSNIGNGFFPTMGVPILFGRNFNELDTVGGEPVMIVNETFARRYWPGGNAVGKRVGLDSEGETICTIIGIAKDGKYRSLGENPRPYMFLPYSQRHSGFMHVIARTTSDATALVPQVRQIIKEIDNRMPIMDLVTIPEHLELMLFLPRALASLLTGLGFLSLILGATGLYGIVAYDVSRRTREVGIRISLGAQKSQVLNLVLWDGLRLVITGTLFGLGLALLTTRFLRTMLYGISPVDPLTFAGVFLLFLCVATAATLRPARRASSIDPIEALRYE